ncbi:hypothetical protein [Nostoc sp. DedSLP04]|uniref:hypothetical protein n=1 Tax=Nostoc sp. DedSLP04 TaxID=3075401 RepID=UPI002AD1E0D7|nr:hypothetical protein [Nostoc sp. DedSLP04]MDZ8032650.1 hypothetical protein [Nostoc sp. DedSLP04]
MADVRSNPGFGIHAAQLGNSIAELAISFEHDKREREKFTMQSVAQYPDDNVVISHNGGKISGNYVTHEHLELRVSNGIIGYERYRSPKGKPFEFVRNGDGGYINWAYCGEFTRKDDNTIVAAVRN